MNMAIKEVLTSGECNTISKKYLSINICGNSCVE